MGTITTGIQLATQRARQKDRGKSGEEETNEVSSPDLPESVPLNMPRHVELDQDFLLKSRVMTAESPPAARAAYKMLRTRVLRRMQSNNWGSLAITSMNKSEGKTLTAINLAISIASQPDQSVILVDLDLRNPTVYRYLGLSAEPGLDAWFNKSVELDELLLCPGFDRLFVVPNKTTFSDSSERLQSQEMRDLVSELRVAFPSSMLLFDLPPLLEADDVLAFAPQVDATLLVVSQGQTDRARLPRAHELLDDTNLLGTVLNKSDEAISSYY